MNDRERELFPAYLWGCFCGGVAVGVPLLLALLLA